MKRKLYIIPLALSALALSSCGGKALEGFARFENAIYESEDSFITYNEVNQISDPMTKDVLYSKITSFEIFRGEELKTSVETKTLRLADDGSGLNETTRKYRTVGEKLYERVNDTELESPYTIPTYFLTFIPHEEYFNEGYTLTEANDEISFEGSVKDDMVTSFFLNKSFSDLKDLRVSIKLKSLQLVEFKASYKTKHQNDAEISVNYTYPHADSIGKPDYHEAVFHFNGGKIGDLKEKITYAYDMQGRDSCYIVDPNIVTPDDQIVMPGYHIEGWYREPELQNRFDFSVDKMNRGGIELWPKWLKDVSYTYGVYYKDDQGNAHKLGDYKVEKGDHFEDYLKYNNKVKAEGYTSFGYLDEQGKPWDHRFTHPGGDDSVEVKVFLDVIKGVYELCYDYDDIKKLSKNKNYYIVNDIDCEGKKLKYNTVTGVTILGNNHKISNFEIDYKGDATGLRPSVDNENSVKNYIYISLFTELINSSISNLAYENANINLATTFSKIKNIVISPFALKLAVENEGHTELDNVSMEVNININSTPAGVEPVIVSDSLFYRQAGATVNSNCRIIVNNRDNRK